MAPAPIQFDRASGALEGATELSILERIKLSTHVGYNVVGTANSFWQNRINMLNADATRRMQ